MSSGDVREKVSSKQVGLFFQDSEFRLHKDLLCFTFFMTKPNAIQLYMYQSNNGRHLNLENERTKAKLKITRSCILPKKGSPVLLKLPG